MDAVPLSPPSVAFTIAAVTAEDAEAYVRAHIEFLAHTYEPIAGAAFGDARRAELDQRIAHLHDDIAETTSADAAGREPFRRHLIARDSRGDVMGVASAGLGAEEWEEPHLGERWFKASTDVVLSHLYTASHTHGTGLGQALLDAALPGRRPAYLWVYDENRRAVRFYERNGFVRDGLCSDSGESWGSRPMSRMHRL